MSKYIELHGGNDYYMGKRAYVNVDNISVVFEENSNININSSIVFNGGEDTCFEFLETYDMVVEAIDKANSYHIHLLEDGTLRVDIPSGKDVTRVHVNGADHWGDLYYPDED